MRKRKQVMTQKAAIVKALEERGGRARLTDIYPRVIELATFKEDSDKQATIRTTMKRHPELFRHSPGKPEGWWELISFQEEIADLKQQVSELTETNRLIGAIPKEADFVDRFLKEVMNEYKRKRGDADPIRNILRHMGHEEAAAVLDAWIDEKEDELTKALLRLAEKPTYKYERGAIHLDKKHTIEADSDDENISKIENKSDE